MAVIQVQQPLNTKISRLGFLDRFTDAEAVLIDLASIDNPSGTTPERQGAALLRRFLDKVKAASHIDLARADTVAGVGQLESLGLLNAGRADEILDTSNITDTERYTS